MLRVAPHEEHLTYLLTRAGFCDEDSNPIIYIEIRASGNVENFTDQGKAKLNGGIAEAIVCINKAMSAREIRHALWGGVEQASELIKDKLGENQREELRRIGRQYLSLKWGWAPLLPKVYGIGITMAALSGLLELVSRKKSK